MNLNSLIIAAEASRARLFRTARTNIEDEPVELIEVDTLELHQPTAEEAPRRFARQIAEQAGHFAQYHFCNPIIVVGPYPMAAALVDELGRAVPLVSLRTFVGESAGLPPDELLDDLDKRGAFAAVQYPCRA